MPTPANSNAQTKQEIVDIVTNSTEWENLTISAVSIQYVWTGVGLASAPSAVGIPDFTLGIDSDGIATANVFHVINETWVKTGSYLYSLYGNSMESVLALGPIYENSTYRYFGEAWQATDLDAAGWRVRRLTIANGRVQWCDGNTNFDNLYTNLAVVSALNFPE